MAAHASPSPVPTLRLPPAFRLVVLEAGQDAFAHACGIAGESGAGTFVWAERADALEFAVILEPEEPLASARRAVFAGMVAMGDAVASFSPPEKPVTFRWPTAVLFDGACLGGARLASPEGCADDEVPEWLVFSGLLLAVPPAGQDPGAFPDVTWLEAEGFPSDEHTILIESFARHLMVAFDSWSERGFQAVADAYLARVPKEPEDRRLDIDVNGDLLRQRESGLERLPLRPALADNAWFGPASSLSRLRP